MQILKPSTIKSFIEIDLRSPSPKVGDFFGVCRWRPSFPLSGELTLIPFPKDLPAGEHTLKESAVAAADGDLGGVRDRVITLKCGGELQKHDLGNSDSLISLSRNSILGMVLLF